MNKGREGTLGLGVVTIFTVLIVLSLSVFSALTLSSAQADLRLSRINAETVSAYYAADIEAELRYRDFLAGEDTELAEDIPVSETQLLRLHLRREGGTVRILSWDTVSTVEAELEQGLNLWDGETAG